jgi:hypothetical protein
MFIQCIHTVCLYSVFIYCVYTVHSYSVFIQCVHIVFIQCVSHKVCRTSGCYYMIRLAKKCCINVCPSINRYIITGLLMYVRGCNRQLTIHKFNHTFIRKSWVTCTTKDRYPPNPNLFYNTCPTKSQTKPEMVLPYCM